MKLKDLPANTPVIVAAKRTSIMPYRGAFASLSGHQLGSIAIKGLLAEINLAPEKIQRAYLGNVLQAGQGQAPARQAVLNAGLSNAVDSTTVNKVCASGLWAGALAANDIRLGACEYVLAGGFESMTNAPHCLPTQVRMGMAYGGGEIYDTVQKDGLTDPYNGGAMGCFSDKIASEREISREAQDAFAAESYRRAINSQKNGLFAKEIVPVSIPQKKGEPIVIAEDGEPALGKIDRFPELRAAFGANGTATAANSSSIDDGAAVYLIASAEAALRDGLTPIAWIAGYDAAALEPAYFTIAPIAAVKKVCDQIGWNPSEVECHEVNEAFTTVPLAYMKELKISQEQINIAGGAVAMGHPIGASGGRILCTGLTVMKEKHLKRGLFSICNGGGGAVAMAVELIEQ
jgi:acetyl-CoA C-acetyltransferase